MNDGHELLKALTTVLCVAGVTTVLFQRLKQPVVLGYILAGLIVGPHVPIPLSAHRETVEALSELGVILLMFSLGLEFRLRKLLRVGPTAGLTAVIQCSIMLWLGYVTARMFGWTLKEGIYCGAIIAISSTTIIAKQFDEQKIHGRLREIVVGVLVIEDLIAILLMAALTALSSGEGLSLRTLAASGGRLGAFLIGLMAAGLLIVPRTIRAIHGLQRPETLLVASVGLCFAISMLASSFGYSVALGAFLAGSLVAESGEEKHVERLVQPVRDLFAAIFFVSVGLLIDPAIITHHWMEVAVLSFVVVAGKVISVTVGAFLSGNGTRTSVEAGMSMAQIGEFSFIIAALGVSLNAIGNALYPIAVAVSAITTLTTPWLIRAAGPTASFVDRKLPRALQMYAVLYGSWLERLRTAPRRETTGGIARRLVKFLLLDTALLCGLVIATSLSADDIAAFIADKFEITITYAYALVIATAFLAAAPFGFGIFRIARKLGVTLAEAAVPKSAEGRADFGAAPRRALVVTLQLVVVLLVGLPLVASTQPFVPGFEGALVFLLLLSLIGYAFWRSATNLKGHVRAGAEMIVEALASQSREGSTSSGEPSLAQVNEILPGLGEPVPVRIDAHSPAVGRTLASLRLRGVTGATVLVITRGKERFVIPHADEVLREGDVLAIAGTHDAVDAARRVLGGESNP